MGRDGPGDHAAGAASPLVVERVLEGRLQRDPTEPVAALPFEVPPGATRIDLGYAHAEGNVLDLGLLDPRATPFVSRAGFRGWSGGARREAFVAIEDATPGYLPGPLPSGTWQVLLGRAKVAPEGCAYRVDVRVTLGGSNPTAVAASATATASAEPTPVEDPDPLAPDAAWYPGDLQSHTHHSDAKGSVAELLVAAEERGLRFLAVTDHNTISHHADLRRHADGPVLPVPGLEVTTYRGHANVWGASDWVDFRITGEADVAAMARRAHELGGLVSVNHPKTQPGCIGCDWTYDVPGEADALEAWQGPWWLRNWESLARYDALVANGRRLTLVGGSDRHQPAGVDLDPDELRVGSPTTWLRLQTVAVPDVLAALRAGQASVSESPSGPFVRIEASTTPMGGTLPKRAEHELRAVVRGGAGDLLRWVGARGVVREVAIDRERFTDAWFWRPDGAFVRAEVVASAAGRARRLEALRALVAGRTLPFGLTLDEVDAHPWVRALSNPIYV
ncbi:MAG: CehA/McbA family metallohydrolase [Trueperaceae bacterium]